MSRSTWKITVFSPISNSDTTNIQQPTPGANAPFLLFQNRSSFISTQRINYRLAIYNGQRWFNTVVTPERVGHRVGEFSPTRKRPMQKKKKQIKKK